MVSLKSVERQLRKIRFNHNTWNHAEAMELPAILLPDEEIFECVNGWYEGGFALLVATNLRVLLVDKKPFKFLTVEDLRFDMINEIDYSHRLLGASIRVSAGTKNLQFRSYNQERLRKLIGHVQHRMAEIKKEQSQQAQTQQQHLEKINQQLQTYLLAQFQHQEELRRQLEEARSSTDPKDHLAKLNQTQPLRPSPELSDYLYAQNLLRQYEQSQAEEKEATGAEPAEQLSSKIEETEVASPAATTEQPEEASDVEYKPYNAIERNAETADLYAEGRREILGLQRKQAAAPTAAQTGSNNQGNSLDPLRIAYSAYAKLPLALRRSRQRFNGTANQRPRPTLNTQSPSTSGSI